ncbi:ATP-binding protein [Tenggerimyces flavus]|uniref:AAA+ ATPase domain-containing protein n=1 Tax=Tenggerimyces flavus TaxID=1708749 RepID=A0ABV7Y7N8_9ACTN|nr:ATP-binding protein [Tenggerimyces flavus]MBM7785262.1 hypothetical protein [Tenggerimyces flavus]
MSNRPLLDTRTDADLFVGRELELNRLTRAVELGLNALVVGTAGVGKTSLLRQLAYRLRGNGQAVHHLTAGRLTGVQDVLDQLEQLRADATQVVLLDEPELDLATNLFGRLRDELWQLPFTWIVAVEPPAATVLAKAPIDAFFEVRLEIDPLAPGELRTMLDRRLPAGALPDSVLDELTADDEPRRVLDAARQLLTGASWPELKEARKQRDTAVGKLSRPEREAIRALESVGGAASASDPDLLAALGWTRARAVQVLGALAEAGILIAESVRGNGAGRPRKVYRLALP